MIGRLGTFCVGVLLLAPSLGAPAFADAGRHLELGLTAQPSIFGPLEPAPLLGELDIDLRPGGDVTGFFRNESDRIPIVVTGSVRGDRVGLTVGLTAGALDIDGTLDRAGQALTGTALLRGTRYTVSATPCDEGASRSILCQ